MVKQIVIQPNPGPQTQVLASSARVVFAGGTAGWGKSVASILYPIRYLRVPNFSAVFFRRKQRDLQGPGSLWDLSHRLYRGLNGKPRFSYPLRWRFGTSSITFSHLQQLANIYDHQGFEYTGIHFAELTQFMKEQFWYMFSRNRSGCGVRPYIFADMNPDANSFVREIIDWWVGKDGYVMPERSGLIRYFIRDVESDSLIWADRPDQLEKYTKGNTQPTSFTYITGTIEDNPHLDPSYKDTLKSLDKVTRERLLYGNWNIKPSAGLYFRASWFDVLPTKPANVKRSVRGWDKAATKPNKKNPDPDWTVGVKVSLLDNNAYVIEHVTRIQGTPREVEREILNTAKRDGVGTEIALWQDPGEAGVSVVNHMVSMLRGYRVSWRKAVSNKIEYASLWSPQVEVGNVSIVEGQWNEPFLNELESFPEGKKDDQVDASSIAFLQLMKRNSLDNAYDNADQIDEAFNMARHRAGGFGYGY